MNYNTKKNIALLVDYDNFNQEDYFDILYEELNDIGNIVIGRVYFSNEEGKSLSEKFRKLDLDPIYQLRFSSGKNALDIRIAIEAIELLSKDYINAFCLATHDADFTPLVRKLKENNKYVIGAGKDKVSKHFKDSCDTFINVQQIFEAKNNKDGNKVKTNALDKNLSDFIKSVNKIIIDNMELDGYLLLSKLSQTLYSKNKEFNPKNFGASNNKILSFFQTILKDYYNLKKINMVGKLK